MRISECGIKEGFGIREGGWPRVDQFFWKT
jgi:hypothetical protein